METVGFRRPVARMRASVIPSRVYRLVLSARSGPARSTRPDEYAAETSTIHCRPSGILTIMGKESWDA
jgi:hypothetical protein